MNGSALATYLHDESGLTWAAATEVDHDLMALPIVERAALLGIDLAEDAP